MDGFSWNLIFENFFENFVGKTQVWLKSDKNNGYCSWRPVYLCDTIFLSYSWFEKYFMQSRRENQTHIFCSIFFFLRGVPFMR
jgi:hypothetical protein